MVKSDNRSKAGKKLWASKSESEKKAILARLAKARQARSSNSSPLSSSVKKVKGMAKARNAAKKVHHKAKKMPVLATGGLVLTGVKLLTDIPQGSDTAPWYAVVNQKKPVKAIELAVKNATKLENYYPAIGGMVGSYAASKLGVNRHTPIRL